VYCKTESRLERTTNLLEGITTLLQKVVETGQDQSTTVGMDKADKRQSNRVGVAEPASSHAFEVCKVYIVNTLNYLLAKSMDTPVCTCTCMSCIDTNYLCELAYFHFQYVNHNYNDMHFMCSLK